jgi:WD40 repeat protein
MYPGLSGEPLAPRQINDVDMLRDNFLFDVGRNFMAVPANDQKNANVVVVPTNARPVFGLKQPRIKAPGERVSVAILSPYEPNTIFVGTTKGIASFWDIPPTGLKGDANKPATQKDLGDEIKAAAFHPIVPNIVAIGLRNGRVQIFDKSLGAPLLELVHQRPINAVAWSADGQQVYVLYIDLTLKIFDARQQSELKEIKVSANRGLGFIAPLPNGRVLVSFSQSGKQELRVYDSAGAEALSRQVSVGGTPLSIAVHFTGLIVAVASRESKLYILDPNTLADVSIYTAPTPITAAGPEIAKPDPDGAVVLTVSTANANNSISRVEFRVPSAPALFEAGFPTFAPTIDYAAWSGGDRTQPATEPLVPTAKPSGPAAVEDKGPAAPQTFYKYLQPFADPPAKFYIDLPVGQAPNPEFNEIATNGTDFAFVGAGGTPPIVVLPLDKPGRFPSDWKRTIVDPHGSGVTTLQFSPHNPRLLVSGGEDCKVKLWALPDNWDAPLRESEGTFNHSRRVGIAKFSQATRNLLLTATPQEVLFWDLNLSARIRTFDSIFPSPIQDADQNEFSSLVYAILRDGNLVAFDPRAESPAVVSVAAHPNGGRHRRVLNIPDFDYVATFGSSDRGERQVRIWDRKSLEKPLKSVELDTATGSLLPLYEEGSGLIYLGGKGDGHIRYLELARDERVIASMGVYETSAPERGLCLLPRKCVDIMGVEVSKMLKIQTESMHVVHWKVPRTHTEFFQDLIFPPIRDTKNPLFEVVDWTSGANETWPFVEFQPPNTKKASEAVPKFRHTVDKSKFHEREEEAKPLTIEEIVSMAPKLSSSDDEVKKESDSW